MLKEFRDFMTRGNIMAIAIAFAMAAAFTKVIDAVISGFITPIVGFIVGKPFDQIGWTWRGQRFNIGLIINAAIIFAATAAVIFFFIVKPLMKMGIKIVDDKDKE